MNILGHGVDLVEIHRIDRLVQKYSVRFLQRLLAPNEIALIPKLPRPKNHFLAGRFAAKEAILKALGIGFQAHGPCLPCIEILPDAYGRPWVTLKEVLLPLSRRKSKGQPTQISVSITHSQHYALAQALWITVD